MSAGEILLWIILPYVAVATFLVGTWWRYRADQFVWTSGSTQLFEQKILGWAGPAFHWALPPIERLGDVIDAALDRFR